VKATVKVAKGSSIETRLADARMAVEGYYANWVDEIEARDRIILEAVDDGWSPGKVGEWAGLSGARVTQIVARRAAEAQG
jgi:hypothetical protein